MTSARLLTVAAICFALALIVVAAARSASGYRYDGRPVCAAQAVLQLSSAQVAGGHVAVWSGVFGAGSARWAQAGVGVEPGRGAFVYVEARTSGGYMLRKLRAGRSARVTVTRHGRTWRVAVDATVVNVVLPDARCFVGAEAWDDGPANAVSGVVRVGGARFGVGL